jgi:HK97 family phage major capsid protein
LRRSAAGQNSLGASFEEEKPRMIETETAPLSHADANELYRRQAALQTKIRDLAAEARTVIGRAEAEGRDINDGEQQRIARLEAGMDKLNDESGDISAEIKSRILVNHQRGYFTPGTGPAPFSVNVRGDDPHKYVNDNGHLGGAEIRAAAGDALDRVAGIGEAKVESIRKLIAAADTDHEARLQLAKSDPDYMSAFLRMATGSAVNALNADQARAWEVSSRAAITVTGSGSVLVPTSIDPGFILTNDGAGPNSIRDIARVVTVGTTTWRGVLSAGVTSSMDSENTEVSDDSPTVSAITAPLEKAQGFVQWSYEAEQDQDALVEELRRAMADAKFRLEEAQFGAGTGTPPETEGIVTALDGGASEDTSPATAETLALADLYDLMGILPTRHLASDKLAWLMHPGTALSVRALTNAETSAQGTWTDISAGRPPLLLGAPTHYHDSCFNWRTVDVGATATNTGVAIIGDWSRYLIADHSVGTMIELIPNMLGSNRRPDGTRGAYLTWRFAGRCLDIDGFRMLSIPTTA